jgi:peptidoglycan/LPS O-acetylase OafA/YrhL
MEQPSGKEKSSRNMALDGWRGIMALFIAAFHLNSTYIPTSYLPVEFFFILSGFLLMKHLTSLPDDKVNVFKTPVTIVLSKIRRFWGLNFICVFSMYVVLFILSGSNFFPMFFQRFPEHLGEFFFLQCSGLKMNWMNGPAWYLSALILGSYFVTALFCWNRKLFLSIAAPLLIMFTYAYISQTAGKLDANLAEAFGFINVGLMRGIAGLCVGALLFCCYTFIKNKNFKHVLPQKMKNFLGLIDIINVAVILRLFILNAPSQNDFIAIPAFCIAILFSALNWGITAKFMSLKPIVALGRISLEVFLIHYPAVFVEVHYFSILKLPYGFQLLVHLSVSILLAIFLHFVIEPQLHKIGEFFESVFKNSVQSMGKNRIPARGNEK